jgi:hypothetical protein
MLRCVTVLWWWITAGSCPGRISDGDAGGMCPGRFQVACVLFVLHVLCLRLCVRGVEWLGGGLNRCAKCSFGALSNVTILFVLSVGSGELVFWPKHFEVPMLGGA